MPRIITKTDKELSAKKHKERLRFANTLKALLRSRKITQSDLARKIWNTVNYNKAGYEVVYGKDAVSAWVNGKRGITPINMDMLCKALGVTSEDLWPGYDPEENMDDPEVAKPILAKLDKVRAVRKPFHTVKLKNGRYRLEDIHIDLDQSELWCLISAFDKINRYRRGKVSL
jgi:transcriptional regulator with XRE-family HTH domain